MKFFKLSLPTMAQIYDSKIFKYFGASAKATDTAKILGASHSAETSNQGCLYRTSTPYIKISRNSICVGDRGEACYFSVKSRKPGIRPLIKFKSLDYLPSPVQIKDGVYTFTLGKYITNLAEPEVAEKLSERENELEILEGIYEFDSADVDSKESTPLYEPRYFMRFSHEGNTYVNLECLSNHKATLSNGKQTEYGKSYWVKEEPVVWLADSKLNFAMTRDVIIGGLNLDRKQYTGNLSKTTLGDYLKNQFSSNLLCDCDEISFKSPGQCIKTERAALSSEIQPNIDAISESLKKYSTYMEFGNGMNFDIQDSDWQISLTKKPSENSLKR